ncbi:MAG: carboxypeptidase regulatory-like domain-containing protein [Anaerolineae bacterium]|nr:carboxypeptidase regulatory-like domain-containing protein [Anaerolineae bacterium]
MCDLWRSPGRWLLCFLLLALVLLCVRCQFPSTPTFVGTVRDAQTQAFLSGARVHVMALEPQAALEWVATSERGRFRLPLPQGQYQVQVVAPGYLTATFPLKVGANVLTVSKEVLLRPAPLQGCVRDAFTQRPIEGALVRYGTQEAYTDAQGRFCLQWEGKQALQVSSPRYQPLELSAEVLWPEEGQAKDPVLELALSPYVFEGRVYEEGTRNAVPGAQIRCGEQRAQADAQGRFALRYLAPGEVVQVSAAGYRPVEIVYEGQTWQEVSLSPWQVRVRVLDPQGKPIAGAQLLSGALHTQTDEHGQASLRFLEPGARLQVSSEGYRSQEIVYTGQGELTIVLAPARLFLSLRDAQTGDPIVKGAVLAYLKGEDTPQLFHPNEKGLLTIEDVWRFERLLVKVPGYRRVNLPLTRTGELMLSLEPFSVHGIYIPFGLLTKPQRVQALLDLVEQSDALNAVVIDVKGDRAWIVWPSEHPLAKDADAYLPDVLDLEALLKECRQRGIYTIARIVVFKDNLLALAHPELAVKRQSGDLYVDNEGLHWVDPFNQQVRDYNIALALEAVALGFDEVQFDYLRFPSDGSVRGLVYQRETSFETRTAAIGAFCAQAQQALAYTPAFLSADVFGLVVWTDPSRDMGIGQRVEDIAPYVDYLSPMLYPSTFGRGNLGLEEPMRHPYEVVYRSVRTARRRTDTLIRPWLQHYSLWGVIYDLPELLLQRKAAEDAGSCGWLYWNAGGKYDSQVFAQGALKLLPPISTPTPSSE